MENEIDLAYKIVQEMLAEIDSEIVRDLQNLLTLVEPIVIEPGRFRVTWTTESQQDVLNFFGHNNEKYSDVAKFNWQQEGF